MQRAKQNLPALLVVGLGMVLIAGLATMVWWMVARRRAAPAAPELPGDGDAA